MIKSSLNNNNNNNNTKATNVSNLVSFFQNIEKNNCHNAVIMDNLHIHRFKTIKTESNDNNNNNNNNTSIYSLPSTISSTATIINENHIKISSPPPFKNSTNDYYCSSSSSINHKEKQQQNKLLLAGISKNEADVTLAVNSNQQRLLILNEFKDKLTEKLSSSGVKTSTESVNTSTSDTLTTTKTSTISTMVALSETAVVVIEKENHSKMSILSDDNDDLNQEQEQDDSFYENPKKVHTGNTYEAVNKSNTEDTFTSIPLNDDYQQATMVNDQSNTSEYKGLDINLDEILSNIETIKTEIIDDDDDENVEIVSSHNASANGVEGVIEQKEQQTGTANVVINENNENSGKDENICKLFLKKLFCLHRPIIKC